MKSAIQTVTLAQPHGREVHNSQIRSRIPPQRGERKLAGGERSEPPDTRGTTIRTPAGVAGTPCAPAGAHSFIAIFQEFALAHARLSFGQARSAPGGRQASYPDLRPVGKPLHQTRNRVAGSHLDLSFDALRRQDVEL